MPNTVQIQSSRVEQPRSSNNIFSQQQPPVGQQQPPLGVRQDKHAAKTARIASRQPSPVTTSTRAECLERTSVRSHILSTRQHPAQKVTAWIPHLLKAELERAAARDGVTISKTIAAYLEMAVRMDIHQQQEAMLFPMFRKALREEFRAFGNRIVFFLMRIAFAAEQSRILITNVLKRILKYQGMPDEIFTNLVDQSNTMARRNIIQKTPQLKTLLEEWERAYPDERREEDEKTTG